MKVRAFALAAALAAAGCGSSAPTAPEVPILSALFPGQYSLHIYGVDSSATPGTACFPANPFPEENSLFFPVDLRRQGGEWIATAAASSGNVVLRFTEAPASNDVFVNISGSITGRAADTGFLSNPPQSLTVIFTGPTTVEGRAERAYPYATGFLRGSADLTNAQGIRQTCPTFSWQLSRAGS